MIASKDPRRCERAADAGDGDERRRRPPWNERRLRGLHLLLLLPPPLLPLSTWKRKTGEQNVYAHELLFVRCRDSKSVYKNRSHKIFLDHFWRETILLFFSPPISSSSGWVRSYRNLQLTSTISNGKEQNKVVISTIDQRVIRTNEDVPVYCKRQTQAQQRKR